MNPDDARLIEIEFPLEQVSLDSVHEKNVRHGHISTLHIWPARRPLAACRAALVAVLLPDPGNAAERKEIYRRLAGEIVELEHPAAGKADQRRRKTKGGTLHWGRENDDDLNWFRERIRKAYGGRAPKVLDPFAGGGAIPLEAMRLGCEATAADINPVAWFVLKCTLDYPHRLAGKTLPLPNFALTDRNFMDAFLKAKGLEDGVFAEQLRTASPRAERDEAAPTLFGDVSWHSNSSLNKADFSWHVRAWARRVIDRVRENLASWYPTYAEFQPLALGDAQYEKQSLKLLVPDKTGKTDVGPLNARFGTTYLQDLCNPRWVAKPTVAYLWARTVRCKACRAVLPLLKTCWLCKKDNKRVRLTMMPKEDRSGMEFGIETAIAHASRNAAQRREHDRRLGAGTMSRSGARCPCCLAIMTMEDIRLEGCAGRLHAVMTAVVVEGPEGKEYRLPESEELRAAEVPPDEIKALYADIPFGVPEEPLPGKRALGASLPLYGFDKWAKLFTSRQLMTQRAIIKAIASTRLEIVEKHDPEVADAIVGFLACIMDRQADYGSAGCRWVNGHEMIGSQFSRFALPIVWDTAEVSPFTTATGGLESAYGWVTKAVDHLIDATSAAPMPRVEKKSAIDGRDDLYDVIVTDPPYYDAIPYSDTMDFFHVWLRRLSHSIGNSWKSFFSDDLGPKWDAGTSNGELIDDASRFNGDKASSKQSYEDGMASAFRSCHQALRPEGRLVIVFASKNPDAWETLVAALIRAGFVVVGSWPIRTERQMRLRSVASAALASSVWLICRKRAPGRAGWDTSVRAEMRNNIVRRLREFWDAGIRGPDFVWAATGPALEVYSKHPVVKKADEPGEMMTVSEFLREVRRIVVDFVVGRVLTKGGSVDSMSGLDDVTTYYLLHRGDFGLDEAPAGTCILYGLSCNLSDRDLSDRHGILLRSSRTMSDELPDGNTDGEDDNVGSGSGGSKMKLLPWNRRKAKWIGHEGPGSRPVPLIDRVHRLMHLWCAGDEGSVNSYIDDHNLGRHELFSQVLQALIELASANSGERSILESLNNHIAGRLGIVSSGQASLQLEKD